jgi:hypothetical protein
MREAFAHDAVLELAPDADEGAPGARITVELCGHWEHEPPCPLAAHHTSARRVGDELLRLHVLFAAEPADEGEVRRRIDAALASGELDGPDGRRTRWRLREAGRGAVADAERAHARRLASN